MPGMLLTPNTPIFLVGFLGSGKAGVGEVLGARLGRSVIDLDKWIEARAERMAADLISNEGEERFRELESEALQEVAHAASSVILLGGGAVTRPNNRALIKHLGIAVWLDAPFELCWRRIQLDSNLLARAE